MAKVYVLPGVERRDIGGITDHAEVLQAAIDAGVTDVVIVGRDRAGELYVAGSDPNADRTVGLLMRAVQFLASADVVQDGPIELDE